MARGSLIPRGVWSANCEGGLPGKACSWVELIAPWCFIWHASMVFCLAHKHACICHSAGSMTYCNLHVRSLQPETRTAPEILSIRTWIHHGHHARTVEPVAISKRPVLMNLPCKACAEPNRKPLTLGLDVFPGLFPRPWFSSASSGINFFACSHSWVFYLLHDVHRSMLRKNHRGRDAAPMCCHTQVFLKTWHSISILTVFGAIFARIYSEICRCSR